MLQSMGSQTVGQDLVTEQKSVQLDIQHVKNNKI